MPSRVELILKDEGAPVAARLEALRQAIMAEGLEQDETGTSAQRAHVWHLLTGTAPLGYAAYAALVGRGASAWYGKINDDTHRTLATDAAFGRRVSRNSLSRLLNALAWSASSSGSGSGSGSAAPYVQGVNVLAAPVLYASRSEPQALALLSALLGAHLPAYVAPGLAGVHRGLALLDRCLAALDPALAAHLAAHGLAAATYAFPSVMTLSACTPPLAEVLRLWDFLLACGVHLNVLAIVAQLVLMRADLLAAERPGLLLRAWGGLQGRRVVEMTVDFAARLDPGLYGELVEHTRLE